MIEDIKKLEMIGLHIEVTSSGNKNLVGLKGTIIDETKNTFTIKTKEEQKKLLKAQIVFITEKNRKKIKIDGKTLAKKPEERIKTR